MKITENTNYVHVHITSIHSGDDCKSEKNDITKIFVGDGETIEDKKRLLWERVNERANIWFDVGFDTIACEDTINSL